MDFDQSPPQHFHAANQNSASYVGAESVTSRVLMHHAIDEGGNSVRVASILPRYRVAGDGSGVVEDMPQWFTERGERMLLLCDAWFEVVGTQRKLRVIK